MLCGSLDGRGVWRERIHVCVWRASHVAQWQSIQLPKQETWVRALCQKDPLEKEMATHSGNLVWEIRWTEEPGGLQSMRAKDLDMT